MKKTNVALLGKGFCNWGGGIEFLRICLAGLARVKNSSSLSVYLLLPEDTVVTRARRFLSSVIRNAASVIKSGGFIPNKPHKFSRDFLSETFRAVCPDAQILFYPDTYSGLRKCLRTIDSPVIMLTSSSLGQDFPYPWTGYVYDFQHKYFPEFFSKKEILRRDSDFAVMLSEADMVIVNSTAVAEDIKKFFPARRAKVTVLPFCPIVDSQYFGDYAPILARYNIPKRYFVICNQFWVHKGHKTAFEAFFLLRKMLGAQDISLVCTGSTYDYRFPDYFPSLKSRVAELGMSDSIRFLGHISKRDQIGILRGAIAVVQPTLFEGGPGGGSVYDAVAYGVPAIVSDIPVNREISEPSVIYFQAGSAEDLAKKMLAMASNHPIPTDEAELVSKSETRSAALGEVMMETVCRSMQDTVHDMVRNGLHKECSISADDISNTSTGPPYE